MFLELLSSLMNASMAWSQCCPCWGSCRALQTQTSWCCGWARSWWGLQYTSTICGQPMGSSSCLRHWLPTGFFLEVTGILSFLHLHLTIYSILLFEMGNFISMMVFMVWKMVFIFPPSHSCLSLSWHAHSLSSSAIQIWKRDCHFSTSLTLASELSVGGFMWL